MVLVGQIVLYVAAFLVATGGFYDLLMAGLPPNLAEGAANRRGPGSQPGLCFGLLAARSRGSALRLLSWWPAWGPRLTLQHWRWC